MESAEPGEFEAEMPGAGGQQAAEVRHTIPDFRGVC